VLAAWGITTDGKPAFIGLAPGSGESANAWHDFLADLKDRGLASPLPIISDGAPGLIFAIEQSLPQGPQAKMPCSPGLRATRGARAGMPGRARGHRQCCARLGRRMDDMARTCLPARWARPHAEN